MRIILKHKPGQCRQVSTIPAGKCVNFPVSFDRNKYDSDELFIVLNVCRPAKLNHDDFDENGNLKSKYSTETAVVSLRTGDLSWIEGDRRCSIVNAEVHA